MLANKNVKLSKAAFLLLLSILLFSKTPAFSDASTSPAILPEVPGSTNGGNPFQGLGRSDDTGPNRTTTVQQYVPGNTSNGLFSTGSAQTPAYSEQAGFAGQAGFAQQRSSGPNAASDPTNQLALPDALNSQVKPSENQRKSSLDKHSLFENASPSGIAGDTTENVDRAELRSQFDIDKSKNNPEIEPTRSSSHSRHSAAQNEANHLALALSQLNKGSYLQSIQTVDQIIVTEPKNAQAFYIKAVASVFLRKYEQARSNYESVLQYSKDAGLIEKAKAGLSKLGN